MKPTRILRRHRPRTACGVSLVELCAVLAILAITAATAVPGARELLDGRRLDGAATTLLGDLQYARSEAVARNESVQVGFISLPGGSCYVLHTGAAGDCSCPVSGPATCVGSAREIKTVRLAMAADRVSLVSNVGSMRFDPLHGTVSPTGTVRLLGAAAREIRHVVNIAGRVRSCSPNALAPGYPAC
jgi:type IV fimbrial biogenesis protein FimT